MEVIAPYMKSIESLCRKHNVAHLFVFGSILSDSFNDDSDIDFIVDFSGVSLNDYADNYYDLKFSLEVEIRTWLYDILQSIKEIDSYFEDKQKIFEEYLVDIKTKRAIERNLEIIGEAVNRIIKKDPKFTIENAQRIVGTRNRIIHGYDNISDELVWSIVINHLPKLRVEIARSPFLFLLLTEEL